MQIRRGPLGWGAALALAVALLGSAAEAGRRPFFWVYDTEVLPARAVEVEQWVWAARMPGGAGDHASLWWAPVVGLTDQLELALPVEWYWRRGQGTAFDTAGVDLRWRLFSADPDQAGPWVPLLRVGVKSVIGSDALIGEANAVVGVDVGPRLHAAVDLGVIARTGVSAITGTYAAGASYLVTDELRLGAELFGELFFNSASPGFVMAGPNLSYTLGRFWLTAGALIGLSNAAPRLMPRLIWAVAF
jgi:hypothetical protein